MKEGVNSLPTRSSAEQRRRAVLAQSPGLEIAEQLFSSLPNVLFCVKDRSHRYVSANAAFVAATLKTSIAEVIGQRATDVFPPLLAAGYEQQDDDILVRGIAVEDRLEMITRADGGTGWYVSQKVPVKSPAGLIIAIAGISRDLGTRAIDGQELGGLADALDEIHRDFRKAIRVETLAQKSGFSWSQFQRRITAITGLPPRRLITKLRIDEAARLLRTTERSLAEIAGSAGFYDQSAMSRQFRQLTGLSPGAYRQATRQLGTA
jgi:AraC-like DNA-binding protein